MALWREHLAGREHGEVRVRVHGRSGVVQLRCGTVVVRDRHGRPRRVLLTVLDVGREPGRRDRAQQDDALRAARARGASAATRFAELLAVVQVAVAMISEDGVVLEANEAAAELVGRPRVELLGSGVAALVAPEDLAAWRVAVADRRAGGVDRLVSRRVLVHADGSRVHVESHQSRVVEDGAQMWLTALHDVSDRLRREQLEARAALTDPLTGLANRPAVMELLGALLEPPRHGSVAVLLCDVDRFKRVNVSLGHDVGDVLLVELAARLSAGVPPCCTPARLSGDEFAVVCRDVAEHAGVDGLARAVAALLRTTVSVGGQEVAVSVSIGAAVAARGSSPTDLLRHADAAVFEAKRSGPGRVAVAGERLRGTASDQVRLESELRGALAVAPAAGGAAGLHVHYQPVVAGDGRILSAEALLRWQHPRLGLLLPGQFLAVAEQGALARELDEWVLRAAAAEAVSWPEPVGVAVNLSGIDPGDPDFVAVVDGAVAPTGLPWSRLVLELVETRLVDLSDAARSSMAELSGRGVRFAVDDFGTGYSSLARLKELPVQVLKVDRSFVAGVGKDPGDFAVVRAIVDLARAMGRTCVAEGVETTAQFQVLRGMGVDGYQGWLFCRALDAVTFGELVRRGRVEGPGPAS